MSDLRYLTAGESHGRSLTAILEGMPSGVSVTEEDINKELARRQKGYGRGARMAIEADRVQVSSGIRWGETLGSPITMQVFNKDWATWEKLLSVDLKDRDDSKRVIKPRPGHADLVGMLKYDRKDAQDILDRASARETAARVVALRPEVRVLFMSGHVDDAGLRDDLLGGAPMLAKPFTPEDLERALRKLRGSR